jgi:hypothetical protein
MARLPIERDDESTSFDARPWGGQQRLIPLANRFARGTDAPPQPAPTPAPLPRKPRTQPAPTVSSAAPTRALQASEAKTSVFVASSAMPDAETILQRPTQESLPVPRIAQHEISGELESPVARMSAPVEIPTEPVPALTYCAVVSAPVEPSTMPMLTPVPQPMPQLPAAAQTVAMRAPQMPARHPIVAISRKHAPKAVPAYSVKHGCSVGGYVVPHLPRVAEVFRHSDSTVAVRRRPLTARSLVAVPIGAVLSVVAILTIYLAQSSASAAPKAAAVAAPAAHVMKMTTTIEAPAPVAAPVVMPVAAPITAAASPAGEPVIVDATPAAEPTAVAAAERTESRRSHSSRHKKPRRIVAVDASTPLGNLRPGH